METVTQTETGHLPARRRNRRLAVATVSFRCPEDVRLELSLHKARTRDTVAEVCIAALKMYLGMVEEAA